MSDMSAPGDLVPYDLEADPRLLWLLFPHEGLAVGDTIELKRGGDRPDRVVRVTRVVWGPGGQVMYEWEPTEAEIEVTPENAQRLVAEGKTTRNRAREAHGLPPFEPPHDGFARTPRACDWPVGGPGCPRSAPPDNSPDNLTTEG